MAAPHLRARGGRGLPHPLQREDLEAASRPDLRRLGLHPRPPPPALARGYSEGGGWHPHGGLPGAGGLLLPEEGRDHEAVGGRLQARRGARRQVPADAGGGGEAGRRRVPGQRLPEGRPRRQHAPAQGGAPRFRSAGGGVQGCRAARLQLGGGCGRRAAPRGPAAPLGLCA